MTAIYKPEENLVVEAKRKEDDIFYKLDKASRRVDTELARTVTASMTNMLGNKKSIAVRVAAN